MINVVDVIGKCLDENAIGVYDEYGVGGNIFAGKLNSKDNNQIVLSYKTTQSFLDGKNTIGNLTVKVYNRNYHNAVRILETIEKALANQIVAGGDVYIKVALLTTIEDIDVSNETTLLCVQSKYKTQIIN